MTVPTSVPPVVHVELDEGEADALQTEKLTDPAGAPPVELPVTVAESLQALPTVVLSGVTSVVAMVGVAGPTVKHSSDTTSPFTLSLEPEYLDASGV